MCGYSNLFSFKSIENDDINYVEEFVRNEMLKRLSEESERSNRTLTDCDKADFFGQSREASAFKLTDEDRQIIHTLVDILKQPNNNQILCTLEENEIYPKVKRVGKWFCHKDNSNEFKQILPDNDKRNNIPIGAQSLISKLLATANRNAQRPKQGYQYNNDLKRYFVYNRILSGPLGFNTLHMNLDGCIPSISTTNRYIHRTDHKIVEGILRCDELVVHLTDRGLPLWVSLSEDATRIDNRIQYDPHTNQLIGFSLPICQKTGMPVAFSFKARSAEEIINHLSNDLSKANFVNTVMAQPLGNTPPFCILLFGSDNRYTSRDTANRWISITNELKRVGIGVVTISSDSDPKYNAAMRKNANLGSDSSQLFHNNLFKCGNSIELPFYVQDHFHILTKMRNLLGKTKNYPKKLPFGKYFVSLEHLAEVIRISTKDQHFLSQKTIDPVDKQNVDSAKKICDAKVITILKNDVKKSEATAMFLEVMSNVTSAYIEEKLSPAERISKIWYSVFIIRIWRHFIENSNGLTLKNNFMSTYCYYCIELNAHSLILILLYLRKNKLTHLFIPLLFNSQACEEFYRKIRSFTTTYSTVASCSIKEILDRISRIQLLSEISNDKESGFTFPKELKSTNFPKIEFKDIDFPDESEIVGIVQKCKSKALKDAFSIGLLQKKNKKSLDSCCLCHVPQYKSKEPENEDNASYKTTERNVYSELRLTATTLKNYAKKFDDKIIDDTSSYAKICVNKKTVVVKKSSICWLFKGDSYKTSSDRRYRVMAKIRSNKSKPKCVHTYKSRIVRGKNR